MYTNFSVINEFLSEEECDAIVGYESELDIDVGAVGGKTNVDPNTRMSSVGWIDRIKHKEDFRWLFTKLDETMVVINQHCFDIDYHSKGCVALQYTVYDGKANGHYDYHMDEFLPGNWPDSRKLTLVVQLSKPEEYEGGEFLLRDTQEQIPDTFSNRGSAIIFPSILYHKVCPVTSGMRRSLVGWYRGPTWR